MPLSPFEEGAKRGVCVSISKIAEKGVSRAERKKPERGAIRRLGAAEEAVHDFVGCAVTADGDELAVALCVSFGGKINRVAAFGRSGCFDPEAAVAQLRELFAGEFCGFAAASRGVNNGEKPILLLGHGYNGSIAEERSSCARRSARMFRFILSDEVRGKSSSRRTTPWTRLEFSSRLLRAMMSLRSAWVKVWLFSR